MSEKSRRGRKRGGTGGGGGDGRLLKEKGELNEVIYIYKQESSIKELDANTIMYT